MSRILVTGGAGFLGSHLCELLLARGHDVIALDNMFTGRRDNVEHLFRDPRFELVRGDVCEPFHFEVDEVYHLACPASPVHYQRNPVRTIKTAVMGTLNALECARDTGARVLIASTSEVYGDPEEHPQTEGYWGHANPIGPRACYDEGKRCAEAIASSWTQKYSTQVRIARIFNCYGPRMAEHDGRVVSSFITQALRGKPITVFGDGSQTRSFVYVDDLIDGLTRLMAVCGSQPLEREHKGVWLAGQVNALPVNIGNPNEFTIRELADMVIALVGRGEVVFRDLPVDDPKQRRPDIARARALLDWNPKIDLETGLRRTIAWWRRQIGVAPAPERL